jgi:hypothetical protein
VVEQLGVRMTKDQVSRLCRALDEQVAAFRARSLEGADPYLWLDAKQEKVGDGGHGRSEVAGDRLRRARERRREVIGLDVGEIKSEAFWREFLRSLRRRGLDGVRLCVSDRHEGLKAAIARVLGCAWQRCWAHFVRDMHQHCRPAQRALVSAALREAFKRRDGHAQGNRDGALSSLRLPSSIALGAGPPRSDGAAGVQRQLVEDLRDRDLGRAAAIELEPGTVAIHVPGLVLARLDLSPRRRRQALEVAASLLDAATVLSLIGEVDLDHVQLHVERGLHAPASRAVPRAPG